MELWWRKFGLLDEATFAAAIDLALDSCEWFPKPVQFAGFVEAVMTPEERGIQEGIRLMRSWVRQGVLPACRDAADLAAIKQALGLPAPSADEVARLDERNAALRRSMEARGESWAAFEALPPGAVVARLLAADRRALVAGR